MKKYIALFSGMVLSLFSSPQTAGNGKKFSAACYSNTGAVR
jgi:hypothetical protein